MKAILILTVLILGLLPQGDATTYSTSALEGNSPTSPVSCPTGQYISSITLYLGFGITYSSPGSITCTVSGCLNQQSCSVTAPINGSTCTSTPGLPHPWTGLWIYSCSEAPAPILTSATNQMILLEYGQYLSIADSAVTPSSGPFSVVFLLGLDDTDLDLPAGVIGRTDGYWAVTLDAYMNVIFTLNKIAWNTTYTLFHPATANAQPTPSLYHFAFVCSSTGTLFYVNGVQMASKASLVVGTAATSSILLGQKVSSGSLSDITAYYDEFAVYNSALSAANVMSLAKGVAIGPTATGFWKFENNLVSSQGAGPTAVLGFPTADGASYVFSPPRLLFNIESSFAPQNITLTASSSLTTSWYISSTPRQFFSPTLINSLQVGSTPVTGPMTSPAAVITYIYSNIAGASYSVAECPSDLFSYQVLAATSEVCPSSAVTVSTNNRYNFANAAAWPFITSLPQNDLNLPITLEPYDLDFTNALKFGDADNSSAIGFATIPTFSLSNPWSVGFWFSPGVTVPSSNVTLLASCSGRSIVVTMPAAGGLSVKVESATVTASAQLFTYNRWYYISFGETATNLVAYVNGGAALSTAKSAASTPPTSFRLGSNCAGTAPAFGLKITDFRYFAVNPNATVPFFHLDPSAYSTGFIVPLNNNGLSPHSPRPANATLSGACSWKKRDEPSCIIRSLKATITTLPTKGILYQTSDGISTGVPITTVPTDITDSQYRLIYVTNQTGNTSANYDSFFYTATDQGGVASSPANVTIQRTVGPLVPTVQDLTVTVLQSNCSGITLPLSDSDPSMPLFAVITETPRGGSLYADANCSTAISYPWSSTTTVPHVVYFLSDPFEFGTDHATFVYYAEDTNGLTSALGQVIVNVLQVLAPPVAFNVFVTAPVASGSTRFSLNGLNPNDPTATIYYVWNSLPTPTFGNVTDSSVVLVTSGGSGTADSFFFFVPGNSTGSQVVTYYIVVNSQVSNNATVNFTITEAIYPPLAFGGVGSTTESIPVVLTVSGTDPQGLPLIFRLGIEPEYGVLSFNGVALATGDTFNSTATYTPYEYFFGTDYFTFQAYNGFFYSDWAYFNISVSDTPSACTTQNINVSTLEDTPVDISIYVTYHDNADFFDYSASYSACSSNPGWGSLLPPPSPPCSSETLSPTVPFSVKYTPNPNLNGTDSFQVTFTPSSGSPSCFSIVTVSVLPVPDPPTCNNGGLTTGPANTIVSWAADIATIEADEIRVYFPVAPPAGNTLYYGTPPLIPVQNYPFLSPTPSLTFGLLGTSSTAQTIFYNAVDVTQRPYLASSSSNCTAQVMFSSNTPPSALSQYHLATTEDTVLSISFTNTQGTSVITTTTFNLTGLMGNLSQTSDCLSPYSSGATPLVNSVYYCPPPHAYSPPYPFTGFTYTVTDSAGRISNSATITIDIVGVANAPIAYDIQVNATENSIEPIVLSGYSVNTPADQLRAVIYTLPSPSIAIFYLDASATQVVESGNLTSLTIYTLSTIWPICTYNNCTQSFSVQYRLYDPETGLSSAPATITVSVTAFNYPPEPISATFNVPQSSTDSPISLLGHDPDDTVFYPIVTVLPSKGTLRDSNGIDVALNTPLPSMTLLYTPVLGEFGFGYTTFSFKLQDYEGKESVDTAVATINVIEQNFAPIPVNSSVVCQENSWVNISLGGSDDHTLYTALVFTIITVPSHGTLYQMDNTEIITGDSVTVGQSVIYIPNAYYDGSDQFTFNIKDQESLTSSTGYVQIDVARVVQTPIAYNTYVNIPQDEVLGTHPIDLTGSIPYGIAGDVFTGFLTNWPSSAGRFYTNSSVEFTSSLPPVNLGTSAPRFFFVPNAHYSGSFLVQFYLTNALGSISNNAYINITVDNLDHVIYPVDFAVSTYENELLPITLFGFSWDSLTNVSYSTFQITGLPSQGTLYSTSDRVSLGTPLSVSDPVSEWVIYVPAKHVTGSFSFTYTTRPDLPASATVTINVVPQTFEPVAFGTTISFNSTTTNTATLSPVTITLTGVPGNGSVASDLYACISAPLTPYASSVDPGTLLLVPSGVEINVTSGCYKLPNMQVTYKPPDTSSYHISSAYSQFGWRYCDSNVTLASPHDEVPGCSQEASVLVYITVPRGAPEVYSQFLNISEDTTTFWTANVTWIAIVGEIELLTLPTLGQLFVLRPDGTLGELINATLNMSSSRAAYVPPTNQYGFFDSWTWRAIDTETQQSSEVATVTVTAYHVNHPPVVSDVSVTVSVSGPTKVTLSLLTVDVDHDPLTYEIVGMPASGIVADLTTPSTNITCNCNPCTNCSFSPYTVLSPNATIQFSVSDPNYVASPYATIVWRAFDGMSYSSTNATITISLIRNIAPVAFDNNFTTEENTRVAINCTGIDYQGNAIFAIITGQPSRGTLYQWDGTQIVFGNTTATTRVRVTDPYMRLTFQPVDYESSYLQTTGNTSVLLAYVTVQFILEDELGAQSTTGRISIYVTSVLLPPIAYNSSYYMHDLESKTIELFAFDPEENTLNFTVQSLPSTGSLYPSLSGSTPLTSQPITEADLPYMIPFSSSFLIYNSPSSPTLDNTYNLFTYTAIQSPSTPTNTTLESALGYIQITISPTNDAPFAFDIDVTMEENEIVIIYLTGFDVDAYDSPYPIVQTIPDVGKLYQYPSDPELAKNLSRSTVDQLEQILIPFTDVTDNNSSGYNNTWRVVFSPTTNAHGMPLSSFDYVMTDGTANSPTATVTIWVEEVNQPPTGTVSAVVRAIYGSDLVISIGGSDVDTDNLFGYIVNPTSGLQDTGSQLFQYISPMSLKTKTKLNFTAEVTRGAEITENCTIVSDSQRRVILSPQLPSERLQLTVSFSVQFSDGFLFSSVSSIVVVISRVDTALPSSYESKTGTIVGPIVGAAASVVGMLIVIGIIWYRNTRVADNEDYIKMFAFNDGSEEQVFVADDNVLADVATNTITGTDLERLILDGKYQVAEALLRALDVTEYDALSKALIEIAEYHGRSVDLLKFFITLEVDMANSPGTLFRANSAASKMMSAYSRMIGEEYLQLTLRTPIETIMRKGVPMEVDPRKLKQGESRKNNVKLLNLACQNFLDWIVCSSVNAPTPIKELTNHLFHTVAKKFPQSKHTAVGGFLFLRFFCPAIISPEGFKVTTSPPDASSRRALVLVSKILQNLANNVEFGKKEDFMIEFNEFIRKNTESVKTYFDSMVAAPSSTQQLASKVTLEKETASLTSVHRYLLEFREKVIAALEDRDGRSEHSDSHSHSQSGRSSSRHQSSRNQSTNASSSDRRSSHSSRRLSRQISQRSNSASQRSSSMGSLRLPGFGEESSASHRDLDSEVEAIGMGDVFVGEDGVEYAFTEGELSERDEIIFDEDESTVEEIGTDTARQLGLPDQYWTNVEDLSIDNMAAEEADLQKPGWSASGEVIDPVAALNYVLDTMPPPE